MKATAVGDTVYNGLGNRKRDRFSLFGVRFVPYVRDKYEGMFPENFPTKEEMRELSDARHLPGDIGEHAERELHRKQKIVSTVAREWQRLQK